jgi:uncharacterized protein YbjQ (UPF0145 family)
MDPVMLEMSVRLGIPLALLVVAYFTGTILERRHYASIRERELRLRSVPAVTFRSFPPSWKVTESTLITGSVVISVDYFKRFLSGLRMIVGGRVKAYETLLDRARREALLRLKEDAVKRGYHAIVNVRLETCRMANARNSESIAGLEVLAFGTGVKLLNAP